MTLQLNLKMTTIEDLRAYVQDALDVLYAQEKEIRSVKEVVDLLSKRMSDLEIQNKTRIDNFTTALKRNEKEFDELRLQITYLHEIADQLKNYNLNKRLETLEERFVEFVNQPAAGRARVQEKRQRTSFKLKT